MTTWIVSPPRSTMLPTRREAREMLNNPKVAMTLIIAVTVVVLSFVAGLVVLAWHGRSTEALTVAVVTPLIAALVSVMQRMKSTEAKIDALASKVDSGTP